MKVTLLVEWIEDRVLASARFRDTDRKRFILLLGDEAEGRHCLVWVAVGHDKTGEECVDGKKG